VVPAAQGIVTSSVWLVWPDYVRSRVDSLGGMMGRLTGSCSRRTLQG
jgi:hypothetical protein